MDTDDVALKMRLLSKGAISVSTALSSLGVSLANTMEEFAFESEIIGIDKYLITKYLWNKNYSFKLQIKIAKILKLDIPMLEKDNLINLLIIES